MTTVWEYDPYRIGNLGRGLTFDTCLISVEYCTLTLFIFVSAICICIVFSNLYLFKQQGMPIIRQTFSFGRTHETSGEADHKVGDAVE